MTDIKQAVKELRDALAARGKAADRFLDSAGMCEPDDEPLLDASIRFLPAVLDRLEELELGVVELRKALTESSHIEAIRMRGQLSAERERDAERARFLELRKALSTAIDNSREHGATGSVWSSHLEDLLDRFPVEPEAGR